MFGGQDRGIPPDNVKAFEAAMKKAGKHVEIKIYDDAGHAFENPNNKEGYKPQDAADAWQRTIAFLEKNLKGRINATLATGAPPSSRPMRQGTGFQLLRAIA